MKETIIKSVTALLCVIAICIASSFAVGNYTDAVKELAKYQPASSSGVSGGASSDGDTTTPADGSDTPADGSGTPTDGTTAPADGSTDAAGTTAADGSSGSKTTAAGKTDPTAYTKAQAVDYYNKVLTDSYKQKVTIKKAEQIQIVVDDVTGGSPVKAIANSIVEKYAKLNESSMSFVNGKSTTEANKTADSFSVPTKLAAAGAKTASVKKSGSGYEINITLASEDATLTKFPTYNKQCSYPLDLATVDLLGIKITQADFTYSGTTLKSIVDSKGRATSVKVYMPLAGTGAGKLGIITITAKVHGSWNHTSTYTYA